MVYFDLDLGVTCSHLARFVVLERTPPWAKVTLGNQLLDPRRKAPWAVIQGRILPWAQMTLGYQVLLMVKKVPSGDLMTLVIPELLWARTLPWAL